MTVGQVRAMIGCVWVNVVACLGESGGMFR